MLSYNHVSASCGGTPLLSDISVSFPKGEITTIIGPNGCGKTTLLQCLNGVSKVTSGSITLEGEDFLALPLKERAKRLAFLPQVRTIIPALPTRTLVEHGRFPYLGFARRKSKEDIAIVNQSMAFAHVDSYANQYVDTLSGGIRQRAFFAMTLAQDCDYVVLDEPTTYLDLRGQQDFLVMVKELKEQGKTIILILHDLGQALRISDRLVVMEPLSVPSDAQHTAFAGTKIAACGTPEECLRQHIIENVFHTRIKQFSDEDGIYYFFE